MIQHRGQPIACRFGPLCRAHPRRLIIEHRQMSHDEIDGIGSKAAGEQRVDVTKLLRPITAGLRPESGRREVSSSLQPGRVVSVGDLSRDAVITI